MLDISHLGDRIRSHRKKKLMTIKTLSQYTGLSVGYLSTLEQNKTTPNMDSND
ncbi:helix-turn-helix domain-containing protein [Faecalicatena contorta]|uniref:helix-turn-helix domain-containing protein n=1 Tax=Faecalicatena contorta TaxID=39482 RepID=UPI001F3DCC4E|nr:helix-turn-helix transcriptional regulator [Faecalicatena contorta]MCF2681419.1 helix-turn-helix transcriptional regulator [Faecalicatena contorta]